MPVRHRHQIGDYLMRDDESGLTHYRSEMVQIWNGNWVRRDQHETRNPQEFIKAGNDPIALRHIRPGQPGTTTCDNPFVYVGETGILAPTDSPGAEELKDRGVGTMQIGCDLVVFATAEGTP